MYFRAQSSEAGAEEVLPGGSKLMGVMGVAGELRTVPAGDQGAQPRPGADPEALARFYRHYRERLYALCLRLLRDPSLAEDAVQDTFLRAYSHLESFEPGRRFWPWVASIAERRCLDMMRRMKAAPTDDPAATADARPLATLEDVPAEAAIAAEQRRVLGQALARLPARQRRALMLTALEGWSYADTAEAEGITIPALKGVIWRARQSLRRACEGGLLGLALLPIRSFRRGAHRAAERTQHLSMTPSWAHALASAALSNATAAVVALAMAVSATGGAAEEAARSLRSADFVAAGIVGGAVRPAARVDPYAGPPEPRRSSWAPHRLLTPTEGVTQPEHAYVTTVAVAPDAGDEGMMFAAGLPAGSCMATCPPVLFGSHDGGATWERLGVQGFRGEQRLLLPAGFGPPWGRHLYASGSLGLQRGEFVPTLEDEEWVFRNAHFEVVAPPADLPDGLTPTMADGVRDRAGVRGAAAVSPAFEKDHTVLVGGTTLLRYNAKTRLFTPVSGFAGLGPFSPAFAPDYARSRLVLVGGRRPVRTLLSHATGGSAVGTVYRCERGFNESFCDPVELPGAGEATPRIRFDPAFARTGRVYAVTPRGLYASSDRGRSFALVSTPWGEGAIVREAVAGDGGLLFAAVEDTAPPITRTGLYVSRYDGAGWERIDDEMFRDGATSVAVAGKVVLVGLLRGIACSTDGGVTWARRCPAA